MQKTDMDANTYPKKHMDFIAKVIRIITVPPVMILVLLVMLYSIGNAVFAAKTDMIIAVTGLVLLPVAAYPIHRFVPSLKVGGREKQRKIAFIFSLVGYSLCFVYALFSGTEKIKLVFFTYFNTVVVLTIINKVFGIRASGHAASSISPCVFAFCFGLLPAGIVFGLIFIMSVWASLYLKRHRSADIVMVVVSFVISFGLAYMMVKLLT